MGIRGLKSYLDSNPSLEHIVEFKQQSVIQQRKIIVWDVLGHMRRLFGWYNRETKLFFDFKPLNTETQRTINVFRAYGFELVVFIDGYHIDAKSDQQMSRLIKKRKRVRKSIELFKKLQNDCIDNKTKDKIVRKIPFIPSSGFSQFLENALRLNGCTVYRGSGKHDIDQDIATYCHLNQNSIYGIISVDTDFFGFYNLPKHIKLIHDYRTKQKQLKFFYYNSNEVWNSLYLHSQQERFKLITITGNDFIPFKPKYKIIMQLQAMEYQKSLLLASKSGLIIDELINIFDDVKQNEPVTKEPLLKVIANTIVSCSNKIKIKIDDSINKFYCIRSNCNLDEFKQNVNVIWADLQYNNICESGIHVHDIDGVGFTIQDKVTNIRHLIMKKNLNLSQIKELKYIYDKKSKRIIKQNNVVDLTKVNAENINVTILNGSTKCVVMTVLSILKSNNWVSIIQYNALELQFKFRYNLSAIYKDLNQWPFPCIIFKEYKKCGVPRIEDLTAQCLYWELCKWVCFNPKNILPNIYHLFDGILFHFFCYVQRNNDKHCVMKMLHQMLKNTIQSQ